MLFAASSLGFPLLQIQSRVGKGFGGGDKRLGSSTVRQHLCFWPAADQTVVFVVVVCARMQKFGKFVGKLWGRVSHTLIGFAVWRETAAAAAAAGCRWLTGDVWRQSSDWSRRPGRGQRPVQSFVCLPWVRGHRSLIGLGSGLDVSWKFIRNKLSCLALFGC